ncbi:Zn-ribbon domain-containing OB-fold protein [Cupriavidus numazuensis]|uniref:ChsH2 C-terminal OB-fold domain-containing protein n=1 Tax=Cupriavidus numazuensis TaxID=221992 RepID=A0ABM8TUC5_9BURK|nr:OB-fold domain-containing protein [Cupriavidus numazuensis]CAG2160142.1 hypothetical protein LMG26411_07254 [Cupriavidus numazuensis]
MTLTLLKPALYRAQGTPGEPDHPALLGGACRCGYTFFPWQTYGCERCGGHGEMLTPLALGGRGTVESSAVVHLHPAADRPTPFTIAAIRLDDGPVVRTLVSQHDGDAPLTPGDRVVAVLVQAGDASDLRFTRAD